MSLDNNGDIGNTDCADWLQRTAKWRSVEIYTDWANHYLEKCQKKRLIQDLPRDMQDWEFLVEVVESVTGQPVSDVKTKPKNAAQAVENIGACLRFVESLGVNVDGLTAKDIRDGQLKAILGLFFSLSRYKQQQKSLATVAANIKQQQQQQYVSSNIPLPSQAPALVVNGDKMSKLPSPFRAPIGGVGSSRIVAPAAVARPAPSAESSPAGSLRRSSASKAASSIPAAVPSNASGLRAPQSRLQPPQTPKAVSAAVASPSSKIAPPSSSGKMLKLKFFGGKDKDKEKSATPPSARSDAPAESNRTSNSSSGVSSAHSESLERSGDSVGSPKSSLKALAKRGLKAPSKSGAKSALVRPKEISGKVTGAGQQTSPQLLRKQRTPDSKLQLNRVSKSSEETDGDSAYAGFDSSSPTSSAALSETPMRLSPSSQTSNGSSSKLATPTKVDQRWSPIGAPSVKESVGSPQDGKPVLAVKGIAAPNSSKLAPPATTVLKPTCLVPKSSSRSSGLKMSTSTSTSDKLAQTRAPAKTQTGAPSPTVGVVSPMTHHRTLASQQSEGNQSDSNTSTTSGSRDSDSVSVIFNPSADAAGSSCAAKPPSGLKKPASAEKQRPPVPNRTSSRLETTFDSNDGAVTTETYSGTQSPSLEDAVKPMEPLVPRASPYAFLKGLPQSVNHKVPSTHRNHMTITRPIGTLLETASSTSEDSVSSNDCQSAIRSTAGEMAAGYVSDGDALTAALSGPLAELSTAELTNGYMSEGGISLYARKMQARFREGLEAVRDSMRRQQADLNDSFEDSSSLSSGLSENIDDISTDDLTGSSLSDHQMAAAAFGKYGDYCGGRLSKHQLLAQQQQRHRSSSQQSSSLLQRKLTEQENIDQLLQKCRSSQRGLGTFGDRPRSEATMSHDPAGAPRRSVAVGAKHPQHYNTIGGGGLRAPKLQLSEDGETLHVSRQDGFRSARAPLRNIIRTVEDERDDGGHGHQRPGSAQSHGLTTSPPGISGYHSLDRKRHLINYYNDADYRTANATDRAATMALVSPRRMPNGSLSLPVSHEGPLPPEETAWNRHSVTTASRSPSISSAINGRLAHQTGVMSRSMIVESQELKASPTNGSADISTVANGRSSPHVQNQRLAAAQGFRQNGVQNGHGSPRKTSEGIYANIHREGQQLQLHKLTGADGGRSPAHSAPVYHHNSSRVADPSPYLSSVLSKVNAKQHGEAEVNGSSLSLASTSSSIYSTAEEKYQAEIRKLHREMEAYREKVTTLTAQQTTYANMIQAFDKALQGMIRRVEGLQMVSQQKEDEVGHLRGEIDVLRQLSINAGINVDQAMVLRGASPAVQRRHTFSDQQQQQLQQLQQQQQQQLNNGGTGLVRQPSIESVASQRSSVSTSSKGSKTDKLSLNSFGRQGKKSWAPIDSAQIRSSFTRAFSKNRKSKNGSISDAEDMKDGHSPMHSGRSEVGRLKSISGSASGLDEVGIESLTKLKEELEKKDSTLTDVRLEALLKSDQVDELQEAINRLRSENASLKHDNHRLHQIVLSGSRAGSQTSLPLLNDGDGDSMSDAHGPTSASDRGYCISSHDESGARVKVLVSLDMTGELTMDAACDDSELFIGSISAPTWSTTWDALDNDLSKIFTEYLHRIDPTGSLKLNGRESIIGYQLGRAVRDKRTAAPKSSPAESLQSCASQSATLRLMLQGVAQRSVDALVLDSLIPRNLLERLLSQLTDSRRVILSGACATGKSFLAQKLAEYLMLRTGAEAAKSSIETLCLPEDAQGKEKEAQNRLTAIVQRHKQGNGPAVIVIDNLHNVTVLSDFFGCLTNVAGSDGPYIIGTMNQSSTQMQTTLQVHLNFRMTLFANHMDSVKGYLGRFLRRRLIHEECKMGTRHAAEFVRVVEFLPKVWALLNNFIETANSADVSIGPRLFMSCPISVHESREWFIQLWNCKIIPYLVEAAHEGLTLFGRRGSLEDPTDFVCDEWPWAEGEAADAVLRRLSAKDVSLTSGDLPFAKSKFDPLEALLRLQSNRNGHEINLSSS